MNIHYDLIKKGLLQLIKVDCISLAMLSLIYMYKRNLNQIGQIIWVRNSRLYSGRLCIWHFNHGQSHCLANIMNTGGSIVIH